MPVSLHVLVCQAKNVIQWWIIVPSFQIWKELEIFVLPWHILATKYVYLKNNWKVVKTPSSWSYMPLAHFQPRLSLLVDQWVPNGTCSQVQRSTSVDSSRFESIKINHVKIDWNCNCGFISPSRLASACFCTFRHRFASFETTLFG